MIKKKNLENTDKFLVGCTDYMSHPGSPYSSQWRNAKYLTAPRCSTWYRACCPGSMKSPIHPAPPWHHLHKEPVLDLPLEYVLSNSDGTLQRLRVNLLPPNLSWAGTAPPPVPSTWPRSTQEPRARGRFHSVKGPKNMHVVKREPQKPHESTGFGPSWVLFTG